MDRQVLAQQQAEEIRIMQKVNSVHRDAFAIKYPSQVEHCLRLTMERLQAGLDKRGEVVIDRPDTWRMSTVELYELAQTAYYLNEIRKGF